jgi:mannitol/fructose-specific phosphotransferase system IIA component (Ntr-type)
VLSVAHYTSPELIRPQLRSPDTVTVLAELCASLGGAGRIEDPLAFYNSVLSHERLSSTAMPPGWALPHARIKNASRLSFALGRSATPLDWLEAGATAVRLVFLFAVPEDDAGSYMTLLAALAKLSQNQVRREALLHAPDSQSIFNLLQQVPLPEPGPAVVRT